ncbi:MAG: formylglycine-generating enzyme family protein [Candidatus Wallbacteria bacterium]|nr:formylglycine-generating enzyme family protein [Candidatus Wallbacteria bacterium]
MKIWILLFFAAVTSVYAGSETAARQVTVSTAEAGTGMAVEITPEVKMEFCFIPAGKFWMGSPAGQGENDEHPSHEVNITKSFWIGKYEVTQAQWTAVLGSNPSCFEGMQKPVELVSWADCQEFIKALNLAGKGTYRLPTEAEWEFACRSGSNTLYYWGDKIKGDYCLFSDLNFDETQDVGQKLPNGWGLYDMSGSVREWCADCYSPEYYSGSPKNDPPGQYLDDNRVIRGGSWRSFARCCRSAFRDSLVPTGKCDDLGLRLVYTP